MEYRINLADTLLNQQIYKGCLGHKYKVTIPDKKASSKASERFLSAAPVKHMRNRQLIDVLCVPIWMKRSRIIWLP